MLNELLAMLGYKQKWHVSWVALIPGRDESYGDGVYTFTPRLTENAVKELRKLLAEQTGDKAGIDIKPEQINITGLARVCG